MDRPVSAPERLLGLTGDPGAYPTGPPERWVQPLSRGAVRWLTVLGALLVGFLLTAGVNVGRSAAEAQDERKRDLIALIEARQERVDALAAELEELRGLVAEREESAAVPRALLSELTRVEVAAGLTRLAGPGLRVELADAGSSCRGVQPQDCRITDVDLQLAVNTLFAAGAEAVAVNGERVITTTAIRGAGQSVLVNYRVLVSPYTLEAVGDPERMRTALDDSAFAADFEVWRDRYGLGFSVETVDELVLPAYGGSLRFRRAVAVEAG